MYRFILIATLSLGTLGTSSGCDEGSASECVGHGCANDEINLPEGGEIRLERVNVANSPSEIRTHAWFAAAQSPESRSFSRPPANWLIQDGPDLCLDMRTGSYFPGGSVDSRTYMDVGSQVSFVSGDGEIVLKKALNAQDNAGYGIFHNILYISDVDPALVKAGTTYDFTIAGGPDQPATTYARAINVPADTTITYPPMTDHYTLRTDEDFTIVWDRKSDDPSDFAFISIDDPYGPIGFCFGPQTGHMSIPAAFIASMPEAGNIQFGLVNHGTVARDGRRLDFVGINCWQTKYLVSTSPKGP